MSPELGQVVSRQNDVPGLSQTVEERLAIRNDLILRREPAGSQFAQHRVDVAGIILDE